LPGFGSTSADAIVLIVSSRQLIGNNRYSLQESVAENTARPISGAVRADGIVDFVSASFSILGKI
jgi:hypothetical protein